VLIAAAIILLVMVQKGKGADAGAGFGAGASGTVFGARGSANFLSRSTAVAAALFFATSMGLAYVNRNVEVATSVLDTAPADAPLPGLAPTDEPPDGSAGTDSFELPPVPEPAAEAPPESAEVPVVPAEPPDAVE